MCVCVCERERERGREAGRERERERGIESVLPQRSLLVVLNPKAKQAPDVGTGGPAIARGL